MTSKNLHVVAISGSLRRGSYNRALCLAAQALAPAGMTITDPVPIGGLPHYDGDLIVDGVEPPQVVAFRDELLTADAFLFSAPEFNYGIPGVLKNAIDWGSGPPYASPFAYKPTMIVSAASSPLGGPRAQAQLKQNLLGMCSYVFPYPEFLCGLAKSKFNDALELTDEETKERLAEMLVRFLEFALRC